MQKKNDISDKSGCLTCGLFNNDPESLESIFKNLRIMCSAYASVRGDSGICIHDDRFRLPRTACKNYRQKGK